jgi:hypothetical protein
MCRANLRKQKLLDGFDLNRLSSLNRAAIQSLATCRFIDEKVAALITAMGRRYAARICNLQ